MQKLKFRPIKKGAAAFEGMLEYKHITLNPQHNFRVQWQDL